PVRLPAPHSFPTRRSSDLVDFTHHKMKARRQVGDTENGGCPGAQRCGSPHGRFKIEHQAGAKLASQEIVPDLEGRKLLPLARGLDRKSTRLNSSHVKISYA